MTKKIKNYQYIKAVAVLTVTTIGAGMFAIPYSISQSGYWVGILFLVILGLVMMVLNLMLGEVSLRTRGFLQVPEIIKIYLGNKGYILALFATIVVIYGAMAAYLRASGDIMQAIIPADPFAWSTIFFIAWTYFVMKGLKLVSKWDIVFVTGMVLIIVTLWAKALYVQGIDWSYFRIQPITSMKDAIQPYGVILFSYFGLIAIPYIKKILGSKSDQMHSVIRLSSAITILLYSLFVTLVIGLAGNNVSVVAIISLGNSLGGQVLIITTILALIAMMTSYITMGISLIDSYMKFGNISRVVAGIITTIPPMAFLLLEWPQFNTIIQYAGGIGVSILAVLVILTFWRAKVKGKKIPAYSLGHLKWVGVIMIFLFTLGIISLFL